MLVRESLRVIDRQRTDAPIPRLVLLTRPTLGDQPQRIIDEASALDRDQARRQRSELGDCDRRRQLLVDRRLLVPQEVSIQSVVLSRPRRRLALATDNTLRN